MRIGKTKKLFHWVSSCDITFVSSCVNQRAVTFENNYSSNRRRNKHRTQSFETFCVTVRAPSQCNQHSSCINERTSTFSTLYLQSLNSSDNLWQSKSKVRSKWQIHVDNTVRLLNLNLKTMMQTLTNILANGALGN